MPVRMCVACRKRMDKKELIRGVKSHDKKCVVYDKIQKIQSRGFYICRECLDGEMQKRRVFERILCHKVTPDEYRAFIDEVNENE